MSVFAREFASGVTCLGTSELDLADLAKLLEEQVAGGAFDFAVIYFSKSNWEADFISNIMARYAPGLDYAGCSTAGEISPKGLSEGQILIVLFPRKWFGISAFQIPKDITHDMEAIVSLVRDQKKRFLSDEDRATSIWPFVFCLMDGLSYSEEAVTAALHWGLDDVPLLGGSAGDDLNFNNTSLLLNGTIVDGCAIVIMVKSKLPLKVFKTENFVPTKEKLVVTKSEPEQRVVIELNGASAAKTYAESIGSDPINLAPQSFASHPLVLKVGGEYYCRSIQKVNSDGSLTFFCAIDDGIVLTVAEPTGMVVSTQSKLEALSTELGGIDFVLGFDCVLRQLDARNRQVSRKISEVYQDYNVVGFNTYGEQYRSMNLNQTLTGVAFALPQRVVEV